jgi:hypothetical protein
VVGLNVTLIPRFKIFLLKLAPALNPFVADSLYLGPLITPQELCLNRLNPDIAVEADGFIAGIVNIYLGWTSSTDIYYMMVYKNQIKVPANCQKFLTRKTAKCVISHTFLNYRS